ncbi:Antibiotic biosynthesis monooxygenase [Brevundimonas diminuta]|jgi:heme-degrading monooxygenase HmoA|uniref:antibiotic biosynthesis monooxygenase family protein n=1 Tax=Brevundimonas diminuta TaxID=293 RepID=UPI000207F5C0|nr:antibiotic biosynthesis monooxygenase family protein [Brevundimonas diminuta]EGF95120.1 antibiotic biosynthesis monooxygenase family protein [Brevundimonas diminuta ATCC 11568]OWR18398.1 antibiotic biosynthesis monooxygenase [Brevundimonas diminuta]WQE46094.1 antibiotic biosynthesis monooxygenase family protein [Brevundimonas diminuta]SPU48459.1 Antibiotic biosynthesis monooxygenase [Brevundimonas diminuta]SUW15335.1 Antibiotic biosynthesis monooxygenase [Brevundimonas diminuta]
MPSSADAPADAPLEDLVVLINVFKCNAPHQDELMERLADLVRIQTALPGFVSATLHRGLNGRVAANHAVWADADAWKAMTRHPRIVAAMGPILAIATFEPHLYEPGEVIQA